MITIVKRPGDFTGGRLARIAPFRPGDRLDLLSGDGPVMSRVRFPGFDGGVTANDEWTIRQFRAVALENERLRVTTLPENGGMVCEFGSKQAGRDLLHHHPRLGPDERIEGPGVAP